MTENTNSGCSQRDSAEHEGYAKASRAFNRIWKERDSAQPNLLEMILYKDNLNRAYKRVKANKGAAGIDGMTIEEALPYLKEQGQELINRILRGKYSKESHDSKTRRWCAQAWHTYRGKHILGTMWHPEREQLFVNSEIRRVQDLFG